MKFDELQTLLTQYRDTTLREFAFRERIAKQIYAAIAAPSEQRKPLTDADTKRLDFIESDHRLELRNHSEMIDRGFTMPRWSIVTPLPFDRGYLTVSKGDTLRAAIDAAIGIRSTGGEQA